MTRCYSNSAIKRTSSKDLGLFSNSDESQRVFQLLQQSS